MLECVPQDKKSRTKFALAFFAFYSVFALGGTVFATWTVWRGLNASPGTARVVAVEDGRGVATVELTGTDGTRCTEVILYDSSDHGTRVGDQIAILYAPGVPCPSSVRAAASTTWWVYILVPSVLFIVGMGGVFVNSRRLAAPKA